MKIIKHKNLNKRKVVLCVTQDPRCNLGITVAVNEKCAWGECKYFTTYRHILNKDTINDLVKFYHFPTSRKENKMNKSEK